MAALCACVAFFALGNGVMTMFLVLAAAVWDAWTGPEDVRRRSRTGAAVLAVAFVALFVLAKFGSKSPSTFSATGSLVVFWEMLRWPDWPVKGFGLLLWVPCAFAALRLWRTRSRPEESTRSLRFALLLYGWVLANYAAIAWSRSMYAGLGVQHRYFDVAMLTGFATLFVPGPRRLPRLPPLLQTAAIVWLLLFCRSLMPSVNYLSMLYQRMNEVEQQAMALNGLMPGAGHRLLLEAADVAQAMYPGPDPVSRVEGLWTRMNDPACRRLRPSSLERFAMVYRRFVRPACASKLFQVSGGTPPESIRATNARLDFRGSTLTVEAANDDPMLLLPKSDLPIREISGIIDAPAATTAEVYLISAKEGLLASEPLKVALEAGENRFRMPLEKSDVVQIRLDPGSTAGHYAISDLTFWGDCPAER
jgi:hypothetical protein